MTSNRLATFTIAWCILTSLSRLDVYAQLYVSSYGNNQILQYDTTTGAFLGAFVSSTGTAPAGLVFGPGGDLYVAIRDGLSVNRYDRATGTLVGGGAFASGISDNPYPILFGNDQNLYVGAHWIGSNNVVEKFNGASGAFLATFVANGSGGLVDPRGMVFGSDGNLYVSGANSGGMGVGQILRYNGTTGASMGVFASTGLNLPHGLVFGPDGNLYVSNYGTDSVLRFNGITGALVGTFASGGGLDGPLGLLFGPDNNLYVASSLTNQILRYDGTTGAFIDAFVPAGSGSLSNPYFLTFVGTSPTTLAMVPEPSNYAAFFGLVALGLGVRYLRRRTTSNQI